MDYTDYIFNAEQLYQQKLIRKTKYEANAFTWRMSEQQKELCDGVVIAHRRPEGGLVPSDVNMMTRFTEGRDRLSWDDLTNTQKHMMRNYGDYADLTKDVDNYLFFKK